MLFLVPVEFFYIDAVNSLIKNKKEPHRIFLYRGEPELYEESSCIPSIFRRKDLSDNVYYEKSLYNAIKQNKLSKGDNYLETAIEAQHGEFPSRLLDVSYNSLIALYFAVTPYYHKEVTAYDDKDGAVYVFYVDKLFSPSASNTVDNYDAIINKTTWLNQPIFAKTHKMIDHTKLNNRIIAQQGAFILFQGNDAERIPQYMFDRIEIPYSAKKTIREELVALFGLSKSFVFPEITNYVDDLSEKNKILITEDFSIDGEIESVFNTFSDELDYFSDFIVAFERKKHERDFYNAIQKMEMIINSYKSSFEVFIEMVERNSEINNELKRYSIDAQKDRIDIIREYNRLLTVFIEELKVEGIEISESLKF
ncbi:MAG: FRG domain-containing protein [Clostridia bacterium]|nr:FRG domain-containing protein [Clostridia bacterium]